MSASNSAFDPFSAKNTFETGSGQATYHRLRALDDAGVTTTARLPYCLRTILEALLRTCDGYAVTEADIRALATWNAAAPAAAEIPFKPARVVLQDFTGVPCVVDLAAMRAAMKRLGGDPKKINPLVPVDLVIDHSVQVDFFGTHQALEQNVDLEFRRNAERYAFLRWGQQAFDNFRVVPPAIGIVHQVNLEFLAGCVFLRESADGGLPVAVPDTLVGTDSHTTMINGLGVVGWGVGGIEAEAVMLGQPLSLLMPEVVGFELTGRLAPGATATDLVLTVTEILRKEGVVGKFVEFFGDGLASMTLADRATIANMAPEYGATMGFFPIDEETLRYLRLTGRPAAQVELVERYMKEQGLFHTAAAPRPEFTKCLSLELGSVVPCLAGPKRPQDRVRLGDVKQSFADALTAPTSARGFALEGEALASTGTVANNGESSQIHHGAVVIAAITSCTNTSNPGVMVAAGLVARKARAQGLGTKPWVKTSLAPGSRVVTDYLEASGLAADLDALGFETVGYGCTTCIGNSGPLPEPVAKAIDEGDLVAAAVLSGNRNFEGRVNPLVKANWLASPPLVVAYAIAGTTDIDLEHEPIGTGSDGADVFLRDIWPTADEVRETVAEAVKPAQFEARYSNVWQSNPRWNEVPTSEGELYDWDAASTYIQEPPFLSEIAAEPAPLAAVKGARVLLALGDSVTTDHISPAGSIAKVSPAGAYLVEQGVEPVDFNSYGARRGNDRVMTRGTFANIRIRNLLAAGTEGGVTRKLPSGEVMPVYDAAMLYKAEGTPLVVLAGAEYGTGSSRDWAAKGTMMLGVKAVLAASFERIHRSNLVGMGVLPLVLPASWQELGLTGDETFDIPIDGSLAPRSTIVVTATSPDGTKHEIPCLVRIDTPVELDQFQAGGILPFVLRRLLSEG
ncbi:MAG: aconitate hydratase AcnA [Pirellulales bacterium]|nr:aconitate hydratase AcnA [Pirellulales bacterium]MBL7194284.1 aconitate hydratase AcnA [Pirellulales bacterium]